MFYCESCRIKNRWPESLASSRGRCEVCGEQRNCHDRPSSTLPLARIPTPARTRDRIDKFLDLFTEAEKASWREPGNKAPTFVVLATAYFLGEEPANKELMKRLKESGD